ncbi:MAG: minichromosome maintenance protein MCM [Candidatus Aenigmarchaeota archaeon]|nr:minichromosome maintenance protein MCM [Candidatus Aenigmarchaeota archaeon]
MTEVGDTIARLEDFFRKFYYDKLLEAVREDKSSVVIDFVDLDKFDPILADILIKEPESFFSYCSGAVSNIDLGTEKKLIVRVDNIPDSEKIRIKDLRAKHIGKFIKVDGMVRRASEVKPELQVAIFECPDCGERIEVMQLEKMLTYPSGCECGKKRGFRLVDRKLHDTRYIIMEDPFEMTVGEKPGELKIFLKDDLTTPKNQRKTDPGARLEMIGMVKELPKRINGRKTKQLDIFLECNFFKAIELELEEIVITEEDEKKIKELAKDPKVYDILTNSIAPSMYGLTEVKESMLLQLFGGVPQILPDGTRIRGDVHILLVGDPAAGKTQLLKLIANLVPRGRYVSGKGTTAAGLTATVTRDEEFMGGWVLEAGAIVLSNKSTICIDEFDKMSKEDQINLHEAMSTQTVSISKATIQATLPAQTAVVAGANPKLSRFDPFRPIIEQIDIPDTLLSRFDLKFILRDIPNRERDESLVDHVIKSRIAEDEIKPLIEKEFFKKYIGYVRKNIKPKISNEALVMCKNFFVELRSRYAGEEGGAVPLTLRQFEALIRLSEASAKIRLSETVSKNDAQRAIKLMKVSIKQLGYDPDTGKIDIDRAEGGVSSSKRSKIRIVMDVLDELEKTIGKNIPISDLISALEEEGVDEHAAESIIREMKNKGMLFEPRSGYIQKI